MGKICDEITQISLYKNSQAFYSCFAIVKFNFLNRYSKSQKNWDCHQTEYIIMIIKSCMLWPYCESTYLSNKAIKASLSNLTLMKCFGMKKNL